MLSLEELYHNEKGSEPGLVSRRTEENERNILSFLWSRNRVYGAYEMMRGNSAAAKHYFYQCGRIDMVQVMKYNNRLLDYGLNNVCIMLLSDSEKLAQDYARLRYQKGANAPLGMEEMVAQGESPIWPHSLFMIIQDNWEQLGRNLDIMRKKPAPGLDPDLAFLEAMYNRDIAGIENVLQQFVQPAIHASRIDPPDPAGQSIFFTAAGYAKLAWMKGMPVNINSNLVPDALLPIEPLTAYKDDYDFIKRYLG